MWGRSWGWMPIPSSVTVIASCLLLSSFALSSMVPLASVAWMALLRMFPSAWLIRARSTCMCGSQGVC